MIPHKPFIFMRHGETDWNKEHRIMGSKNIPLNTTGKEQAHATINTIKANPPSSIITSPLSRAYETGIIIGNALSLTISTHEGLAECTWGNAEGTIVDDSPVALYLTSNHPPAGGESITAFYERTLSAIKTILTHNDFPLIIAHGGTYWALMEAIGYKGEDASNTTPYYFSPPNSAVKQWCITPNFV